MIIKKKKINKDQLGEVKQQEQEDAIVEDVVEKVENPDSSDSEIDIFDLDNIDFKQRKERRRGDRRRGFRRIDDRNLISRAREEANAIKEAAAKEGYQAGIEAASNDIQEFREAISEFMYARQTVYEDIAPEVLEISFEIAKKIIKKEVLEDSEIMITNIKEIMKGLSREEAKITVRVNPIQADVLKSNLPESAKEIGVEAKITVIPDNSITEGGCILTTANGVIDATIESQLAVVSEVLKDL